MTSNVKVPNPFGGDYEDPLEALRLENLSIKVTEETISEGDRKLEITKKTGLTNLTELTELTKLSELTEPIKQIKQQPVSPVRDFTKTPNSIARNVMANGLFKGKSKQIYDYLWIASRGSINPARTVRKTHGEIQNGTGIGSLNTVKNGLRYLEQIGLISKTSAVGEASGNIYETFTPEEANLIDSNSLVRPVSSVSPLRQELVQPVRPEIDRTNLTQTIDKPDNYADSKTSFKDNIKNDDERRVYEVFSIMAKRLDKATKKITGKSASKSEAEKWGNLGDLLILELEVAASRAENISSVPAFLTEILRRKFFASQSQKSVSKSTKSKIDNVGKSDMKNGEIKPLSEKERIIELNQLREFADEEFLQDFKKWYTSEDWEYFMRELGK